MEFSAATAAMSLFRISPSDHCDGPLSTVPVSPLASPPLVTGSLTGLSNETGPVLIGPCQKLGGALPSPLSSSLSSSFAVPGPVPPPVSSFISSSTTWSAWSCEPTIVGGLITPTGPSTFSGPATDGGGGGGGGGGR